MTFLAPGAALVAAAITFPVLLALYLLKLRRRPLRVSTILFWPGAAKEVQVNVPLRLIRPSWLLVLHVLILLALLGALARPAASGGVASRGRLILLIDRSASMSARGAPGSPTRLDRARERARDLVREATRGQARVAVVQFAADAEELTGLTNSRSRLDTAIGSVTPTDQPGDLRGALRLADSIAGAAAEETGEEPATAVLLSDGSFPPDESLSSGGVRLRFERIAPAGTGVPANAGIVAISAKRDYSDPATVRLFAEFLGTRPEPTDLPVTLTLDGRVVAARVIRLPAAAPGSPARAGETFEFSAAAERVAALTLPGGDALSSDDLAAVVLPEPRRPAILLVRPDDEDAAAWLLEEVLHELKPRSLRVLTASEYAASGGAGADLVIFEGVTPSRPPPVPSMLFGGDPAMPGLSVRPPPADAASLGLSPLIWKRDHPVLRDVVLESVVASGVPEVGMDPDAAGLTELARGPRGPMIVLDDGPPRRLYIAFDLEHSNWPLLVGFPIFMADTVDYLTMQGDAAAGRSFTTAQNITLRVRAPGAVTLEGPATIPLSVRGEIASAGPAEHAGVYTVKGDTAIDSVVAVNLVNPLESAIASPAEMKVGSATLSSRAGLATPRELWPFALMLAAALLVLEWVLYARGVRA